MKGRKLAVALATVLMTTTALTTEAASDYETGFVKTVDRISVAQRGQGRSENLQQVRDHGKGGHGDRGHYRGDKGRGRHDHHGYRGDYGRHGYAKPYYRYYGRPYYRPYRGYYYDDYLGVFLLGGALGYILNE